MASAAHRLAGAAPWHIGLLPLPPRQPAPDIGRSLRPLTAASTSKSAPSLSARVGSEPQPEIHHPAILLALARPRPTTRVSTSRHSYRAPLMVLGEAGQLGANIKAQSDAANTALAPPPIASDLRNSPLRSTLVPERPVTTEQPPSVAAASPAAAGPSSPVASIRLDSPASPTAYEQRSPALPQRNGGRARRLPASAGAAGDDGSAAGVAPRKTLPMTGGGSCRGFRLPDQGWVPAGSSYYDGQCTVYDPVFHCSAHYTLSPQGRANGVAHRLGVEREVACEPYSGSTRAQRGAERRPPLRGHSAAARPMTREGARQSGGVYRPRIVHLRFHRTGVQRRTLAGDAVHAFAGPALLPAGSDYVQDTRAQRPPPSGRGRRATDITQFYGGAHFGGPRRILPPAPLALRARPSDAA